MSDPATIYLLPCPCGREIPIEPRQAGETVRCECGRTSAAPTMREIRRLHPAPQTAPTPAATKPAWGNSQRYLVTGLVVVLLAALAAVILQAQFPMRFPGLRSPEAERQYVEGLSPAETRWYFQMRILPGLETPQQAKLERERSKFYLGLTTLGGVGAIGLVLVAVGIAGIVRRR